MNQNPKNKFKLKQIDRAGYLKNICSGSHSKQGAALLLEIENFAAREIAEATKNLKPFPGNLAEALYGDGYSLEDIFFQMDVAETDEVVMKGIVKMFTDSFPELLKPYTTEVGTTKYSNMPPRAAGSIRCMFVNARCLWLCQSLMLLNVRKLSIKTFFIQKWSTVVVLYLMR